MGGLLIRAIPTSDVGSRTCARCSYLSCGIARMYWNMYYYGLCKTIFGILALIG